MAASLATLSLSLTNAPAIADAKATGTALENMGVKGESAAQKIAASSNAVNDAIKRQVVTVEQARQAWAASGGDMHRLAAELQKLTGPGGPMGPDVPPRINRITEAIQRMRAATQQSQANAMASQVSALDPFQQNLARIEPVATKAHLSLGRLGQQFGNLAGSIAGTNPIVGNLLSVMGNFAVGSVFTVGVLGALALIAVAFDKITESSRKAREEQQKLTQALADQFAPKTGPQSETAIRYTAALKEQADAMQRLNILLRARNDLEVSAGFKSAGLASPTRSRQIEIDRETERLRLANQALGRARAGGAGILESVTVTSEDSQKRAIAEREQAARDRERSDRFLMDAEAARHRREDYTSARQLKLVPDSAVKSLDSLLTPALIRAAAAAKGLSDSFESAKARLASGVEGWKPGNIGGGIVSGIQGGVGDALARFSPANLAASGITTLLSTAMSGLAGTIGDLLGGSKAAAEAFRKAAEDLKLSQEAIHAAATGNTLEADLLRQEQTHRAQVERINVQYEGNSSITANRYRKEREAALAAEAADNALLEARIRAQHAHDVQYAQEDLVVRNLRATGQGGAADLLAFKNQQAREMQAALDANRDETYKNTLRIVQQNELLAYLNNTISTALNVVSGYRLQATIFGAMQPRSPGSGGTPYPPVTPPWTTPSPPFPGRASGDLTVNVVMRDGTVLGKAVLKDFKSTAQRQFGDSAKWSEIQ